MMNRIDHRVISGPMLATLILCVVIAVFSNSAAAQGAQGQDPDNPLTTHVLVMFDGELEGETYTLGPNEVDSTETLRPHGSPSLRDGWVRNRTERDGILVDPTLLGDLRDQNLIAEIIFEPTVHGQQPSGGVLIDVYGEVQLRYTREGNIEAKYHPSRSNVMVPAPRGPAHFAIVWHADDLRLELFINGVSQGVLQGEYRFDARDTQCVAFGFLGRSDYRERSVRGTYDGIAFSIFTGDFDPSYIQLINATGPNGPGRWTPRHVTLQELMGLEPDTSDPTPDAVGDEGNQSHPGPERLELQQRIETSMPQQAEAAEETDSLADGLHGFVKNASIVLAVIVLLLALFLVVLLAVVFTSKRG